MDIDVVAELSRHLFLTAFMIAGPVLGVGLFVGLLVALFQAVTQINEMTLTFVPKIAAVGTTLLLGAPWLIGKLAAFARQILENLPNVAG